MSDLGVIEFSRFGGSDLGLIEFLNFSGLDLDVIGFSNFGGPDLDVTEFSDFGGPDLDVIEFSAFGGPDLDVIEFSDFRLSYSDVIWVCLNSDLSSSELGGCPGGIFGSSAAGVWDGRFLLHSNRGQQSGVFLGGSSSCVSIRISHFAVLRFGFCGVSIRNSR